MLLDYFTELTDPRQPWKVKHNLLEIVVMTICSVIAGCDVWEDIVDFCRVKEAWFKESLHLKLTNGLPSHDTMQRVWSMIDPSEFERCFRKWVSSVCGEEEAEEREIISIDGKTLRRSGSREQSPVHMVSAWANRKQLVMGQYAVEDDLPVLRGRIEADGGDLTRCHFLTNAAGLTFTSPEIEAAVKQVKARLVIFDPFQAFMGAGVDMFQPNETRPELAKLFEMCDRNDCACVIIIHTGKSTGDKAVVNRSLGSVDIQAAMRSIMQLIRNPDNEDECIMVHVKCSNAPKGRSIGYTIGTRGGVTWTGFSPITVEDLTTIGRHKEKGIPYDKEPLVQVFNQLVTDRPGGGFWSYEDVKSVGAKLLGFPPFCSTAELKAKLSGPFIRELQEKDGLIVTCGHKQKGIRGIRIEQYQHPQGYQTSIG